MTVAEDKFSELFEQKSKAIKHRGAYYLEDAGEKGMALVEAKFKDTKLYWISRFDFMRIPFLIFDDIF